MVNYGVQMIPLAQTDPAWEYWDTSTYAVIGVALTVILTVAAWLVYRYWWQARAQDHRRST